MEISNRDIEIQRDIARHIRDEFSKRLAAGKTALAYVDTYGCQQNESDSEKLRGMLNWMGFGFTADEYEADVIVINTCAIRENAENRVLGNVGALVHTKNAKRSQIIVFCGCLAGVQETVDKIRVSYEQVDLVFPPVALWRFPELLYAVMYRRSVRAGGDLPPIEDIMPDYGVKYDKRGDFNESKPEDEGVRDNAAVQCDTRSQGSENADDAGLPGGDNRTLRVSKRVFYSDLSDGAIAEGIPSHRDMKVRAWLPVMYGCDNFCSYCIVPYVRGRERSRTPEAIIDEARQIVAEGYKDITLLGQNVNSYGGGNGVDFPTLIRRVNEIDGEFLIRFMTSHPKDASNDLFCAMSQSAKAARHIHLPFQAGNDRILAMMNRGYARSEYLERVAAAREYMPDIVITSDVIIGFPGETGAEFEDTLSLIEAARFDSLFIFIYSKRPGTPAAKLADSITREEKQLRFDRLNDLQNSISVEKHSKYMGTTVRVLADTDSQDERYPVKARTNGGRLVHLNCDAGVIGSFVNARITHCNSWSLFGELC